MVLSFRMRTLYICDCKDNFVVFILYNISLFFRKASVKSEKSAFFVTAFYVRFYSAYISREQKRIIEEHFQEDTRMDDPRKQQKKPHGF